ncbi:chromosomal replication initiator protein DnaA [Candidatus Parcubacteria bacterium]|nr:chromosomal replication initiator protein DnaA [Candidatus Parcubacteria bacterium]
MTNDELWQAVLGEIELTLSKPNFNTWFKNTFISSCDTKQEEIVIGVPNAFTQTWLQTKYHKAILIAFKNITDDKAKKIVYVVETTRPLTSETSKPVSEAAPSPKVQKDLQRIGLNQKYTFKNFIVGKNNELAHAACQSVAKNPGKKYNPLFIYGGVGLGKTHMIQAIGHAVLANSKDVKIRYITSEQFISDYVQSVRSGRGKDFQKTYRNVDVLLIDDVQFIAGKDRTQEEFFHTFNTLHQKDSKLVFTADRPPTAIPGLEERLSSRFSWGMIADVAPPDLETRIAILKTKARERNFQLDDESIQYLAVTFQRNIRELESALNKIIAHWELYNKKITPDIVKEIVSNLSSQTKRGIITAKQLIKIVADFYELKIEDLTQGGRRKELALPRQIAMFLLREELECSYPMIGTEFGGRDHTTAMHACKKITKEVDSHGRIKQEIDMLRERMYNG